MASIAGQPYPITTFLDRTMVGKITQLITLLSLGASVYADSSVWGTDFVVPFAGIADRVGNDTLYLFLLPATPTRCTIEWTSCSDKQSYRMELELPDTRRNMLVPVPRDHMIDAQNGFACGVVRIHSNDPIHVLALVDDSLKSEAATILPVEAWGRTYIIPTNPLPIGTTSRAIIRTTIVASGATAVLITAADHSVYIGKTTLEAGEQVRLLLHENEQLTIESEGVHESQAMGIIVQSSRPVGVIAHVLYDSACTVEQLLAAEYWNTRYVIPTYPKPAGSGAVGTDYAIVAAVSDSTVVRLTNGETSVLSAGQCTRFAIGEATLIDATQPISLVVVHNPDDKTNRYCMTVMPPIGSWLSRVVLQLPQLRRGVYRTFSEQYVAVVADSIALATMKFDGAAWVSTMMSISGTSLVAAHRRSGDGMHTVQSDSGAFAPWIIGFGEKYAYATCGDFNAGRYPYLFARWRITDDTVSSRDTFIVRISLEDIVYPPQLLQTNPPERVRVRVRWNSTVATPLDRALQSSMIGSYHVEWIESDVPAGASAVGMTLAELRLLSALGELPAFPIEIDSVVWLDASGNAIMSRYEQVGGTIVVNDIWQDRWGVRLVSPNAGTLTVRVVPNPIDRYGTVILTGLGKGESVIMELYDAMGTRHCAITPTPSELTDGQIPLVRADYASGLYFLRIVSGKSSLIVPVVFQ
ncbi:MAG: T9SS type A sorting domain-containing protein [Chlorobi bacterium]|nr:T9SS type A sorting domain-containing protein [Chlorobiota bacterium]